MRVRSLGGGSTLVAAVAAALLAACGGSFEHSKQRMEQLQIARKEARGAWIVVRFPNGDAAGELSGELVAAGADTVFVLTGAGLEALDARDLQRATVSAYEGPRTPGTSPILALRNPRPRDLDALASHSRFPQGLPAHFDRQAHSGP